MRFRHSTLKRFWSFIKQENLSRLLLLIGAMMILSAAGIALFEDEIGFVDGLWWSIVTLTTVGYGDFFPVSLGGRIIAVFIMFIGIGLLGTLSATIATVLIDKKLKEDRGMGSYTFTDHIIMVEWNNRTKSILEEIRKDPDNKTRPILLIDEHLDTKPMDDDNVHFIKGTIIEESLIRANLAEASTCVIVGDDRLEPTARDAKVVLNTLTVETLNNAVYTIVELADDANVRHCQRAQADEIIVNDEISSGLISRAALNHGISKVVSELLSSSEGNDLHKIRAPDSLVGKKFIKAFTVMKRDHESILLGLQKGEQGEVQSNPGPNQLLEDDDYLIVIAAKRPKF